MYRMFRADDGLRSRGIVDANWRRSGCFQPQPTFVGWLSRWGGFDPDALTLCAHPDDSGPIGVDLLESKRGVLRPPHNNPQGEQP
jgi:hypothetical protein